MSFIIVESGGISSIPTNIKKGRDKIRCEVCLQTANDVNRNKRRYRKELIEGALAKLQERIGEGSLLGELDHPIDRNPVRQVTVLYKEASHRFMETGWDGNKLISVIETLRTPNGTILKNLAEDGIPVGYSFRGMGDLRQVNEGGQIFFEVQDPLHAITWDAVSYPSHLQAKTIKITESVANTLFESVGFIEESGYIKTEDGIIYFPNDFDKLVEQRVIDLTDKFKIRKRRHIGDVEL